MKGKQGFIIAGIMVLSLVLAGGTFASDPIKVGTLEALTGPGAAFGTNMLQGLQMAVDDINAAGGLVGRKVEIISIDDAAQPAQSVSAMTRLIHQDKVDIVIGGWGSATVLANFKVAEKAGVPYIECGASNPRVTRGNNNQWTFANIQNDEKQCIVVSKLAIEKGHKRIAILHDRNDFGRGGRDEFSKGLKQFGNLEPVVVESYQMGDKDFNAQLIKIREAKPDALGLFGTLVEAAAIAIQMKKLGMNLPIFSMAGIANVNYIKLGGEAVEGTILAAHFNRELSPETEAWAKKYEEKFKQATVIADPNSAWMSYSAGANCFPAAVKMAGSMDKTKVRDALRKIRWRDYGQGIDNYFDAEHAVVKETIIVQVKGGEFKPLVKIFVK
jgi:branched-chain amino acid transport system substrate-binding protein